MIYFMQAVLLTFIEALCCKIFFDTFLMKKNFQRKWVSKIFFGILLTGFIGISFSLVENPIAKAIFGIILISTIVYVQYRVRPIQTLFLSIVYYGLLVSIDMIMLTVIQFALASRVEEVFNESIKITILALMCKTILFFPIITVISMFAFALVISNFLVFYIIRDIVEREKNIQEIGLSQERIKNQMDMYRQMDNVYNEQRKR